MSSSPNPARRLVIGWTGAFPLASAAVAAAAALTIGPMVSRMLAWRAFPATATLLIAAAGFGALHGLLVGAAQSQLLRRRLRHSVPHWALATGVGAAIAWVACMFVNLDGVAAGLSDRTWHELVFAGGLAFGAVIGTTQWLALRGALPRAGLWIPANALAWLFASMVVIFGIPLAENAKVAGAGTAIVIATALVASLVAGFIPALVLAGLAARADRLEAMRIRRVRYFTCPISNTSVTATIAEDFAGSAREVETCSAFANPEQLECTRACLEELRRPS